MESLSSKEKMSNVNCESSFCTEKNPAYLPMKNNNQQNESETNVYSEVGAFSLDSKREESTSSQKKVYSEVGAFSLESKGEESTSSQKTVSSQFCKTKKCFVITSVLATVVFVALLLAQLVFGLEISAIKTKIQNLSMEQELEQNYSFEKQLNSFSGIMEMRLNLSVDYLLLILESRLQELNISLYQQVDRLENQVAQIPVVSCAALPPSSPSGYYWVIASNGSAVRVYCDMTRSCGGVTGGWTRVFELDMTNSSQQCPSGLRQRNDSDLRTCGIDINSGRAGCSQSVLPTSRLQYSRVCGRIKAYQVGSPDTFGHASYYRGGTIDSYYVDGMSLTHGNPRQHIWTFAAGLDEVGSRPELNCACTNTNDSSMAAISPLFVGNDYFCDTASSDRYQNGFFYSSDPLWDGAGCGPLNTCCSFNTPPWFYKQLPQPTTDNIEIRVCRDEHIDDNEDTPIEIMEIYVQ